MGLNWTVEEELRTRRLRWLGHVARMDESRIPKWLLFSELPKVRDPGGTKFRWKDRVRRDLKEVGVEEGGIDWITLAQDRAQWRSLTLVRRGSEVVASAICEKCGRSFKGSRGLATHSRYCGSNASARVGVGGKKDIDGTVAVEVDGVWVNHCVKCGRVIKTLRGMQHHQPACGKKKRGGGGVKRK